MEIPAMLFFPVWALISLTFLLLMLYTLNKTELSNSVSPVVISFFKYSLEISTSCSTSYGLLCRPKWRYGMHRSYSWKAFGLILALLQCTIGTMNKFSWFFLPYALIKITWLLHFFPKYEDSHKRYLMIMTFFYCSCSLLQWGMPILPLINFILTGGEYYINPPSNRRIAIQMAVETTLFLVNRDNKRVLSPHFMFTLLYLLAISTAVEKNAIVSRLRPWSSSIAVKVKVKVKGTRKWIEFAVGTVGSFLFQYFFRLTSFNDVIVFLYLAVMWVANLGLLGVSHDYGFLSFLLRNVVVGSTVSEYLELRIKTWLALAASLLLFGLHLMLQSPTLIHRVAEEHTKVKLW